jgi:hypothetical protein
MRMKSLFGAVAVAAALGAAPASSAVLFEFAESGGDVVVTLSGSLNLTDLTIVDGGTFTGSDFITPTFPSIIAAEVGSSDVSKSEFVGGLDPFGSSGFQAADSYSGDLTGANSTNFFFADSYVSEAALNGTMTFLSATFASLALFEGDTVGVLANGETVTIRIGTEAAVPVPASLPLLASGFSLLGFAGWRRDRKSAA